MDPASQLGNTVINLSKMQLSQSENDLLQKGLNFIPTPNTVSKLPIKIKACMMQCKSRK